MSSSKVSELPFKYIEGALSKFSSCDKVEVDKALYTSCKDDILHLSKNLVNEDNTPLLSVELESVNRAKNALMSSARRTPAEAVQLQRNIESAREAMSRMSLSVHVNILGSERGAELIEKAHEYNIPYDSRNINWLELIDRVDEYEALLLEAEEYNIEWDLSEYDPVGLQQEIDYQVRVERAHSNDLYRDYLKNVL